MLRPGHTCWRLARADRFAVIVDAAAYFAAAREAMLGAERTIMLIGWDFDLRIELTPGLDDGLAPNELGAFLRHIVQHKPELRIWILKWDMAVLYTMGRGVLSLFASPVSGLKRIRLRFDSNHPWMAAHHQKIVVIDDALAFCGGIDMTTDRWDTRGHLAGDHRRSRPDGQISGPWHDATAVVDGEAAHALGELARERWRAATGSRLEAPPPGRSAWPTRLRPHLSGIQVAIARTMPALGSRQPIREIERLYLRAIAVARRTIYLESQYFASTTICEALAARLREPDGPEIVVINPSSTDGWLERQAMGAARDLRIAVLSRADRYRRFGIFYPVNATTEPIYVHAKILIVDDRLLRVGSSNVNNRSMGFDTECDLAIEAASAEQRQAVAALENDLLAEHLDTSATAVIEVRQATGSLLRAVEALRRDDGRSLRPLRARPVTAAQEAVARSNIADPERAAHVETRLVHLAKRLALKVPPAVWLAGATVGLASLWRAIRSR